MSEVAAVTTTDAIASNVASPRAGTKKKSGEAKPKPKLPRTHPPMSEMVTTAIETLKGGRHGSSLQAIKKYIGANYKCDVVKLAPFLRKALRGGVEKGTFVQIKGTGASGSFKLVKATAAADAASHTSRKAKVQDDTTMKTAAKQRKKKKVAVPKKSATAASGRVGKAATVKQKATKHAKTRSPPPKKAASAAKKASSPAAVPKKAAAGGGKKK
ncbi:histone H1-II-like [Armigeres subalbatus]|uniref:histone H1-II-like n=1 Tax=Armigeres subalbatus TaxID=124917 RepID=UPI002ED234E5